MPHPVDPGAGAIDTALVRLQQAVGQLEEAADGAALRLASADEEHRSEAAGDSIDTAAVALVQELASGGTATGGGDGAPLTPVIISGVSIG